VPPVFDRSKQVCSAHIAEGFGIIHIKFARRPIRRKKNIHLILVRHIHQLGLHIAFADVVVETHLGTGSWRQVWRHQLRWARTIRVSRFSGYCGYVVTHATLWSLVALLAGAWWAAIPALALRVAAGTWVAAQVLEDRVAARSSALIPVRDLFGFAIWLTGLFGATVEWRGLKLRLRPDGRIQPVYDTEVKAASEGRTSSAREGKRR